MTVANEYNVIINNGKIYRNLEMKYWYQGLSFILQNTTSFEVALEACKGEAYLTTF